MKAKQKCEAIIRKARDRKYQVILGRVDKNMCSLHPEWADLTKEEQGKINRWEVYAHKCYKNIAGGGILSGMFLIFCIRQRYCPV